jgi:hypothetical protein
MSPISELVPAGTGVSGMGGGGGLGGSPSRPGIFRSAFQGLRLRVAMVAERSAVLGCGHARAHTGNP